MGIDIILNYPAESVGIALILGVIMGVKGLLWLNRHIIRVTQDDRDEKGRK